MAYLKEEIKAGIIIFSAIVILSGFTILIGGSQLFEKFDIYYVSVMNAAGLESGSQVKLGGVRVGRVIDIKPPDGPSKPITIVIGLKKGTTIYKGTKALITQVGFVGDIYLQLSVEKTGSITFKPGDTIPSIESVDFKILMAKIGEISESLDVLIKDVDRLFSQSNIKDIEKLVKETTIVLNEIGTLVRDNKGEVSNLLNKARETLDNASKMLKSMEQTVKTVDKTSESVKGAIDLQSQNITDLLTTLNETTEDLQEVLQEIKNKPWSIIYKERTGGNE